MHIPFTQYVLPHGRQVQVSVDRPQDIYEMAMDIIDKGYVFECEKLPDGTVSLTITDEITDHDGELVDDGPDVPLAVDTLVKRFYNELNSGNDNVTRN